jgi:hypothetical protein
VPPITAALIEALSDSAGKLTIVVGFATAVVAVPIMLARGRIEAKAKIAEQRRSEAETTRAEAEAANVAFDTQRDHGDAAMEEADKIIGWLRLEREEQERVRREEREEHRRQMSEQRDYYESALDKMRRRLEGKIDRLGRRVSDFGCKKAPGCLSREVLDDVTALELTVGCEGTE